VSQRWYNNSAESVNRLLKLKIEWHTRRPTASARACWPAVQGGWSSV